MTMQPQQYWREIPQRYRLEAAQCTKCDKIFFPPRRKCTQCGEQSFKTVSLPRDGKIITYTVVHAAPERFAKLVPYAVAIVELSNGVRMTSQVVDIEIEELAIGLPVRLEFRKISEEGHAGILCYGYKAVPA